MIMFLLGKDFVVYNEWTFRGRFQDVCKLKRIRDTKDYRGSRRNQSLINH